MCVRQQARNREKDRGTREREREREKYRETPNMKLCVRMNKCTFVCV